MCCIILATRETIERAGRAQARSDEGIRTSANAKTLLKYLKQRIYALRAGKCVTPPPSLTEFTCSSSLYIESVTGPSHLLTDRLRIGPGRFSDVRAWSVDRLKKFYHLVVDGRAQALRFCEDN